MTGIFNGYTTIPTSATDDAIAKWQSVHSAIKGGYFPKDDLDITSWDSIAALNYKINDPKDGIKYVFDPANRWQTPAETMSLKTGECIDYAVLKYATLFHYGVSEEFLAIILCEIAAMPKNLPHAFLIMEKQEEIKVLDNKFDQLIDPNEYDNLIPLKLLHYEAVRLFAKPFTLSDRTKSP